MRKRITEKDFGKVKETIDTLGADQRTTAGIVAKVYDISAGTVYRIRDAKDWAGYKDFKVKHKVKYGKGATKQEEPVPDLNLAREMLEAVSKPGKMSELGLTKSKKAEAGVIANDILDGLILLVGLVK